MTPTSFGYRSSDGLDIAAYRWTPAGPVRAIVQITHGWVNTRFATGRLPFP